MNYGPITLFTHAGRGQDNRRERGQETAAWSEYSSDLSRFCGSSHAEFSSDFFLNLLFCWLLCRFYFETRVDKIIRKREDKIIEESGQETAAGAEYSSDFSRFCRSSYAEYSSDFFLNLLFCWLLCRFYFEEGKESSASGTLMTYCILLFYLFFLYAKQRAKSKAEANQRQQWLAHQ